MVNILKIYILSDLFFFYGYGIFGNQADFQAFLHNFKFEKKIIDIIFEKIITYFRLVLILKDTKTPI